MWRCLVFLVVVTFWNLPGSAVPQGENTCQGVVKHPVKVKVNVTEPVTFRIYTWCLRVPPRCSKYVVQMKERVKEQVEMHNRTITVCCRGYVEMESKCVPACPPMTECPNMHCNRTNHCYCSPGYSGIFCNDPCPKGSWGRDCKKPCDCPEGFTCHHLTGDCMLDDKPSVKTTVRRAFTHGSSESLPTTMRPMTSSTSSRSLHSTTSTTILTSRTTSPTTVKLTTIKPLTWPVIKQVVTLPPSESKSSPVITPKTSPKYFKKSFFDTSPPEVSTSMPVPIVNPPLSKTTMWIPIVNKLSTPINYVTQTPDKTTLTSQTMKSEILEKATVPLFKNQETEPILSSYRPNIEPKISTSTLSPPLSEITSTRISKELPEKSVFTISSLNEQRTVSIPSDFSSRGVTIPHFQSFPKPSMLTTPSNLPKLYSSPDLLLFTPTLPHSTVTTTKSFSTVPTTTILFTTATDSLGTQTQPSFEHEVKHLDSPTAADNQDMTSLSTKSVNAPMIPMQTPNRNLNPFIPAPGSTQYHDSRTVPFSIKAPVTELIPTNRPAYTIKSDNVKRLNIDSFEAEVKTFTEINKENFSPSTTPSHYLFQASLRPNTFLPSFRKPVDSLGTSFTTKEDIHVRVTPTPHLNPVTFQKPSTVHSYKALSDDSIISPLPVPIFNVSTTVKTQDLTKSGNISVKNLFSTFNKPLMPSVESATPLSYTTNNIYREIDKERSTTFKPVGILTPFLDTVFNESLEDEKIFEELAHKLLTDTDNLPLLKNSDTELTTPFNNIDFPANAYFDNQNVTDRDTIGRKLTSGMDKLTYQDKKEFISILRSPTKEVQGVPVLAKTDSDAFRTDSFTASTYSYKTVPISITGLESSQTNTPSTQRFDDSTTTPSTPYQISEHLVTTPLTPINKEVHVINGKLLEEPSNYLPTVLEKASTTVKFTKIKSNEKSTLHHIVTKPPSAYLPTDKDFLNLTYILNSINDFTSNSKRGMKQSHKSLLYVNPIVKLPEEPVENDLVTNSIYDSKPSTEILRPISVYPTRKFNNRIPKLSRSNEKDSKIIKLNISSHSSFHLPTTTKVSPKLSPRHNPTKVSYRPYNFNPDHFTNPVDGRITTVSILSTIPFFKYPTKRSTKDNLEKTENAFTISYQTENDVHKSVESSLQDSTVFNPSNVTPYFPSVQVKGSDINGEEVSKKPFRRKEAEYMVRSNMTAALAAHSSVEEESMNLTTGILATITCVLLVGSLISVGILFFVYCRKEKPVPMESCIMAYEQTTTADSTSIYSVPRPSLLPEIFFCPTFSHQYAAQINKELRELSYGSTKKENTEHVYNEISN